MKYQIKATGWEYVILVSAYVTVFIAAGIFVYLIFRAAHLIALHHTGVDPWSYAESHLFILLLEIGLWILIAEAAVRFNAYVRQIRQSPEGAALGYIATAVALSFIYAILFDIASTVKTQFMGTPYLRMMTSITNLVPLYIFVLLSVLLFIGALKLKNLLPDTARQQLTTKKVVLLSAAGLLLVVLPYADYFYQVASQLHDDDGLHHFVAPPQVLLVAYLLPFTAAWLLGLLSSVRLAQYAHRVKGKLYRPMFHNLSNGILTAYTSTYLIQVWYVSDVPANRFGFGLVSIIVLIILLIIGYGLMYRGVNQLYALEGDET